MKTVVLFVVLFPSLMFAEAKKIMVFVALCDNETQGIAKVGRVIGDGDKPEDNLYWGCSDGLPKVFGKSKLWKKNSSKSDDSQTIMREAEYKHVKTKSILTAHAYRGSEIKKCFLDFEKAVASGEYDFVCFIGHNALMDIAKPELPEPKGAGKTSVAVLCCLSDSYCSGRIKKMGAKPVLMTRSLMYPGAFILHDGLEVWFKGSENLAGIRMAAGKAYHKNQVKVNKRLTVANATAVFSKLK